MQNVDDDELTAQDNGAFAFKAKVLDDRGIALTSASQGAERPNSRLTILTWEQWDRLTAWVAFQRASQGVKLDA